MEESYASKELVAFAGLAIEHVLPQTLTLHWRRVLQEDLHPDEDLGQVCEGLVHTLGNLTLTGYKVQAQQQLLRAKRPQLAKSGLAMNQEIAELARRGRPEVYARADTKIELHPSFDLAVLAEASARDLLVIQLAWFLQQAQHSPADRPQEATMAG